MIVRANGREGPLWGSDSSRSVDCTKKADLPRQHRSDSGSPPFHILGHLLGVCNGAVEASNRRTRSSRRVFGEGILRGEPFVYVDIQSRPVVRPEVAVMDFGATGEKTSRARSPKTRRSCTPKLWQASSRCRLVARPTGDTSL